MNVFLAGLPACTPEAEIRALLPSAHIQAIEAHVTPTQSTFAFLQVPHTQVPLLCLLYDKVKYGAKTLHLSAIRNQLESCKACLKFGHTDKVCALPVVKTHLKIPLSPLTRSASKRLRAPATKDLEEDHKDWAARNSVLFAQEWCEYDDIDDWPSGPPQKLPEVQVQTEYPKVCFSTPPRKPSTSASEWHWGVLTRSQSSGKKRKTLLEKCIEELQNSGKITSMDGDFKLVGGDEEIDKQTKVQCGLCKKIVLTKNVPGHFYSKWHQDMTRKLH